MKRLFLSAATALSLLTISSIQAFEMHTELDFSLGYRRDNVHARRDTPLADLITFGTFVPNPNLLEVIDAITLQEPIGFKSLDILYADFGFRTLKYCDLYIRGDLMFGWILNSNIHDKIKFNVDIGQIPQVPGILAGEGLGLSISTKNPVKNSYIVDFNIGIGYPFFFMCGNLFFSPMIGYAYDSYNLKVRDYNKTTDALAVLSILETMGVIPSAGLSLVNINYVPDSKKNSRFKFAWYGPWIGFDTALNYSTCLALKASFEYHIGYVRYKRHTHSGFVDLDHVNTEKSAQGFVVKGGFDYNIYCGWDVGAEVFYRNYRTFSNSHPISATTFGVGASLGYTY